MIETGEERERERVKKQGGGGVIELRQRKEGKLQRSSKK